MRHSQPKMRKEAAKREEREAKARRRRERKQDRQLLGPESRGSMAEQLRRLGLVERERG
jgi:hypothetical protein